MCIKWRVFLANEKKIAKQKHKKNCGYLFIKQLFLPNLHFIQTDANPSGEYTSTLNINCRFDKTPRIIMFRCACFGYVSCCRRHFAGLKGFSLWFRVLTMYGLLPKRRSILIEFERYCNSSSLYFYYFHWFHSRLFFCL